MFRLVGSTDGPDEPQKPAARDQPRFLHRHSAHSYTHNPAMAMWNEPEALSKQDQEEITARAHRRHREHQVTIWKTQRTVLEQALDALFRARFDNKVIRQLRSFQRQLDRLDHQISRY